MNKQKNINTVSVRLIEAPQYRHEIVESIKILANVEHQKKEWKDEYSIDMKYIFHALYDDYGDLEYLDVCIQMIDILFYDKEEACLVYDLCFFLIKEIADEINSLYVKDIEYLNHPKWSEVVTKASIIYEIMQINNEKYNWSECLHMFNNESYQNWNKRFLLTKVCGM